MNLLEGIAPLPSVSGCVVIVTFSSLASVVMAVHAMMSSVAVEKAGNVTVSV